MADEDKHQHHRQPNETSESSTQSVLTLLTEVIVEILLRLPVDSLFRCRSVCKSWCSLISDPHFVKSHLALSTRINHYAHRRLMLSTKQRKQRNRGMNLLKSCNLNDVLYDRSVSALELDYPMKRARKSVYVVGSCNGLVCIAIEDDALFIWNPSTRKSHELPINRHTGRCFISRQYGFGYAESSNDYKVVEMACKFTERFKHVTTVEVYSLRDGSWKSAGTFPHGMALDHYATFSNGALHWAADNECDFSSSVTLGVVPRVKITFDWYIIYLDLAKETFGEVLQPMYDEKDNFGYNLTLGSLRECLCVLSNIRGVRADLWVMKVYGVEDSWTKLVSIPYLTDPGTDKFSFPLCISNDGKVLLQLGLKLVIYDPKNNSVSEIQKFGKCLKASTFVESLVSPMPARTPGDRL